YGASPRILDVVLFLLLVLLFVVLVLAWYHGEAGPQRPTRTEGSLLGFAFVVAAAGSVWLATSEAARGDLVPNGIVVVDLGERSLAVLPFRNAVEDPGLAWLDVGLAELLSTNLAQNRDLRVVSCDRVLDLLGQLGLEPGDELPERATSMLIELSGARLVVTGSVFGQPGDLTVTAALVEASTGEIRKSATARGEDVFSLVDEISAGLRGGIGVGHEAELPSIVSLTTGDIDAFQAYERGRRASQHFLPEEAVESYGRALELDSTFALARFRRALALYQLGSISEAEQEARRARQELVHASERDRLFVAAFDAFASDTAEAVATVRELVRKYPDDKDARIVFGGMLAGRRGASDGEARELLAETLKLDPSYAPGYNFLAYSHAGSGDLEAADSLSLRYVELEPDEPNAWDTRGEILELMGHVDEARRAYEEALRVRPGFRASLNHLARSYLIENDPAGARRALSAHKASGIPQVRIRVIALEGDTYLWEGEVDRALSSFEQAEREADAAGLPGLRVWRLRDLVRVHLALGQHRRATEAADEIRELEPLDGWWITALFDSLVTAEDLAGVEYWKPRIQAELGANPLTVDRLPTITRLMDLWIAHLRSDPEEVIDLAYALPPSMRPGVITEWPVFESMLGAGETEMLLDAIREYRFPDLFARGPRFEPIRHRWAQYFEARAHEAAGDTLRAVAAYDALLRGMGEGLTRFPRLSGVPARREALGGPPPSD
ncbi:MAG: tetratricopeptide repeat protein, partial [Gemmatimonadota bacterium]|nr:tetratricopeptide repeat protein [Gemmatimonadota bacterium]